MAGIQFRPAAPEKKNNNHHGLKWQINFALKHLKHKYIQFKSQLRY